MRRAVVAASIVALLLLAYAAAGHWLAPRLVRDALVQRAEALGLALEIGKIATDPFRLTVSLAGVRAAQGGQELASAQRVFADLAWSSLWGEAWRVQQATLLEPRVMLVRGADGRLRWPAPASGTQSRAPSRPGILVERLQVEGGAAQFVDRSPDTALEEVRLQAIELRIAGLSTRQAEPAQYELSARVAGGGALSSQGSISLEPRAANGTLSVAAMPLAALLDEGRGQVSASARYAYDGDRVVLRDVSIEGAAVAHSGVELSRLLLRAPHIVLPAGQAPFEVSGEAALAPAGQVALSGTLDLQPLAAEVEVEADALPLPQANRFLPADFPVAIVSGRASARGSLRIQAEGSSFEGALAVSDARFEERGSGKLLLGWRELATRQVALSFAPFRAEAEEVVASAPHGRLVIDEEGRLNLARLFAGGNRRASDRPLQISVRRLRVEQGTLDFADRSLENEFAVTLRELDGALTGLSTAPADPARVQLEGRVAQYGAARIRGTIDLESPKSLTSVVAALRNVPLTELTPYIVKFAGYRVESGRLSAELRYRVRDGRLVGQNQLTLERLQLGEKVQGAGVADLPLELAVALLTDAQGRINLDIPVSGNLNDPRFDFGGLVARALGNVIGKVASAPFRALASALGRGGENLDQVGFAPGSAELDPPAEEALAQVAKALAERPALAVTVQGGYDAQRDVQALRLAHVRRRIAQRAGVEAEAPLDFGDPRVLQAAERLYLERAGNRPQMLELREREGRRYGRALVEALAAAMPADEEAAEILGRARAEMVRAALLAHGLEPARISVEAPAARATDKQGVPTTLALDTARAAAAGATQR